MAVPRITSLRAARVAVLCAALGFVAAGCAPKSAREASFTDPHPLPEGANHRDVEGRHGGRMVFVTIGDPKTFNSTLANEVSSTDVLSGPLFVGLTTYANARQQVEPGLASSWDVSQDGLVYTWH